MQGGEGRAVPTLPLTGRMDRSQDEEIEAVYVLLGVLLANWKAVTLKHVQHVLTSESQFTSITYSQTLSRLKCWQLLEGLL